MKAQFKLLQSLFLLLMVVTACSACKDDEDDPQPSGNGNGTNSIPDLVVNLNVEENGSSIETVQFNYPKQKGSGAACNGAYNGAANLFSLNLLGKVGSVGPSFSYLGSLGGVKEGTYNLTASPTMSCLYSVEDGTAFMASSGTFKVSKVTLYATVGNLKEYFIEAEVNGIFKTSDNSRTITVTGTFKGVNIKQNG